MAWVTTPIDGGLDLASAPQAVQPGRLIDCLNYEVAYHRGIRRINGYEPYDGGPSPTITSASAWYVSVVVSGDHHIDFALGQTITVVTAAGTFQGSVAKQTSVFNNPNTTITFWFVMTSGSAAQTAGTIATQIQDQSTLYTLSNITLATNLINTTESGLLTDYQNYYNATYTQVQQVPGQGNLNGLFWLRDKLYATRDYAAYNFTAGTTQPNVGDTLYQGASLGAATWSGVVAKVVLSSGSWGGLSAGNAAGTIMVYNTTGTVSVAAANNNTQSINSVLSLTNTPAVSTAAGMYVATGKRGNTPSTQSWQWCDLGWYVNYVSTGNTTPIDMNLALTPYQVLQQGSQNANQVATTAWKTASSGSANGWQLSGGTWPGVVSASGDSQYAFHYFYNSPTSYPASGVFSLSNFGFTVSDIPPNAIIVGVEIQIVAGALGISGQYTAAPIDATIQLVNVGYGPTPNIASSVPYTVKTTATSVITAQYATYGTAGAWVTRDIGAPTTNFPNTLLGYNGIRAQDILNTNFGIQYSVALQGTQTAQQIQFGVDQVRMRVAYQTLPNLFFFWNVSAASPTAVPFLLVMHYDYNGGNGLASDANGTMYIQFVQSNGTIGGPPSRPILAGEQIKAYPKDGSAPSGTSGVLISTTSGCAGLNVMDWSGLMQGQPMPDGSLSTPSKYQSITKNFYASPSTEAIYGVSGGGPAFYYDGIKTDVNGNTVVGNFSRILTGLPGVFETPRSVCAHQNHIVLGYASGLVQWSNALNTLSFNPSWFDQTAANIGVGDIVTGIASVNGDALMIGCRNAIKMLQGNLSSANSLYLSTLSETSGMIEYTMQPMLVKAYCDFRGITSLATTDNYGDFEVSHISHLVSPWLTPRVQASQAIESSAMGVINSVLVRNKNQYRLYFADGYVLTMTMMEGQQPQFTIQRYFRGDGVTPKQWNVIQSFTESLGRERIFGVEFNNQGSVLELDHARGFNIGPIVAYATLVPDVGQSPYQNKRFSGINIYGQATDYATFTLSRSSNYQAPVQATGSNVINETFGDPSATPTGVQAPFVAYGTSALQLEGTAVNLRFDSSSTTQNPHVIQAVSYNVDPLNTRQQ